MIKLLSLLREMSANPHIPANPNELTAADKAHMKGYMPSEGGKWKDRSGKTVAQTDHDELSTVSDADSMEPERLQPSHMADKQQAKTDPDVVSKYEKAYGVERPMDKQNDPVKYNSADIYGNIRNPMQHYDDGYELLQMKAQKVYKQMKDLPEGSPERKKAAQDYRYWISRVKDAAKMSPRASNHFDKAKLPHQKQDNNGKNDSDSEEEDSFTT